MSEHDIEVKITRTDDRSKSNQHRLDGHDKDIAELRNMASAIHEQNVTLAELVAEIKFTNRSVADHEERLDGLEKKPAQMMTVLQNTIITALVSGLIASAVSVLIKLI